MNMKKREHGILLILCLVVYTILPSLAKTNVTFNYITWFIVLYILASYVRYYPRDIYQNMKMWINLMIISIILSVGSIIVCWYIVVDPYFFVSD